MAALFEDSKMLEENSSLIGRYTRSGIKELTFNDEPFLLTGEAWIIGPSHNNFDRVMSISTVSEEDCAGHFGPKFPSGPESLKIPLLHLSRIMSVTAQIGARLIHPKMIPMPIACRNVRANNQNLIPPPAAVVAIATQFGTEGETFSARTFARADGEPYAEMGEVSFALVPIEKFKRMESVSHEILGEIIEGYKVKEELYRSDIEELILEREPFHRLDRAILLESQVGDLRLITISKITERDCAGQLLIDGKSTLSPLDYSRVMALTAELLASIVTRERFDDFPVVPIAVKVDEVATPNFVLFSPPAVVIAEANISAKNLYDPRTIKRGKQLFWADSASAWVDNIEVAMMDKIVYALVPEDEFFEEKISKYKNNISVINPRHRII